MQQLPRTGGSPTRAPRILAVALIACFLAPSMCAACMMEICARVRPQDEVWLVSTREMSALPRPALLCNPRFRYQRYCCGCGWVEKSACDFHNGCDACAMTVIYVHGNRLTPAGARNRGLDFYNGLACRADDRPIRYVIWSWPSSPLPCRGAVVRDARVKRRRTPLQSYYLSWWLTHCCCDCRVSLLGYSYGGRTIIGALQLTAGGSLNGRRLPAACCRRAPRVRIGLWAAATQADWLLPGCPHGRALRCVERGGIFFNRLDPALKCYQPVFCTATGPALGYSGLINPSCGPAGYSRLVQYDVTNNIGRYHRWDRYRHCPCTMNQMCNLALSWEPCSPSEVRATQQSQMQRLTVLMPLIGTLH